MLESNAIPAFERRCSLVQSRGLIWVVWIKPSDATVGRMWRALALNSDAVHKLLRDHLADVGLPDLRSRTKLFPREFDELPIVW